VSSPNLQFFEKANLERTTRVLTVLLSHLLTFTRTHDPPLPNLVGLELVNEPNPPVADHRFLQDWYWHTVKALRALGGGDGPVLYIGDSWRTREYAEAVASMGERANAGVLALDHHLYRCFTGADQALTATQHAELLRGNNDTPSTLADVRTTLARGGGSLVVGEFSAALNPASLHTIPPADHCLAKRTFLEAQLALYERECAGWFWWTYKKQWPGDDGWSLRDAVQSGVFPNWVGLRRSDKLAIADRAGNAQKADAAKKKTLDQHVAWWKKYPGHYEHWRFEDGFIDGWADAYLFFASSSHGTASEIGFIAALKKKRTAVHKESKGSSNSLWEYEHGFEQGVEAALNDYKSLLV